MFTARAACRPALLVGLSSQELLHHFVLVGDGIATEMMLREVGVKLLALLGFVEGLCCQETLMCGWLGTGIEFAGGDDATHRHSLADDQPERVHLCLCDVRQPSDAVHV